MRIIKKSLCILKNNSGESIVEVLVAFTLLSVMMLVFAQGLSFAANSEARAVNSRKDADQSMITLQKKLSSASSTTSDENVNITSLNSFQVGDGEIVPYTYTVNGNSYTVFIPVTTS